jgi:chorismate mutase
MSNGREQADCAPSQEPRLVKVQYFLNEIRDRCNNLDDRLTALLERNRGTTPEVASTKNVQEAPPQGMMYQVEHNVEEINIKLTTIQSRLSELESML